MGDVQQDLLGQQAKLRSEGYRTALDAALKERGLDIQAGSALGGLGTAEAGAGTGSVKALGDIGTQELGYEQAKIDSPLTRAQNVAQILRGYTYPTTTTENYSGPATTYGTSTLGQIAGLGALLGSGLNSPFGWGNSLLGWLSGLGGGSSGGSNTDYSGGSSAEQQNNANFGASGYSDPNVNLID